MAFRKVTYTVKFRGHVYHVGDWVEFTREERVVHGRIMTIFPDGAIHLCELDAPDMWGCGMQIPVFALKPSKKPEPVRRQENGSSPSQSRQELFSRRPKPQAVDRIPSPGNQTHSTPVPATVEIGTLLHRLIDARAAGNKSLCSSLRRQLRRLGHRGGLRG